MLDTVLRDLTTPPIKLLTKLLCSICMQIIWSLKVKCVFSYLLHKNTHIRAPKRLQKRQPLICPVKFSPHGSSQAYPLKFTLVIFQLFPRASTDLKAPRLLKFLEANWISQRNFCSNKVKTEEVQPKEIALSWGRFSSWGARCLTLALHKTSPSAWVKPGLQGGVCPRALL